MITENSVYSDEVIIDAPVAIVWQILVDFDNYGAWNTFCPSVKNEALELGKAVDMMVDLGGGPSQQIEYICDIAPHERIAWRMENNPGDPIHAVRSQNLKKINDEQCSYITFDEFSGPEASAMMEVMAAPVEAGFNRCAYDLKAYAEKLYRTSE